MQVQFFISGTDQASAGRNANAWEARMRASTRYYVGARYVTVLGLRDRPQPDLGRGSLNRVLTYNLELLDNLWRLSDDDQRPTRFPVETDPGMYPFGMLSLSLDGSYSLLGGVTGTLSTLSLPNSGITLTPLELTYDQTNEF